jgi:hypothetical protein
VHCISSANQEYEGVSSTTQFYRILRGKTDPDFEIRITTSSTSTSTGAAANAWQLWNVVGGVDTPLYQAMASGDGDDKLQGSWMIISQYAVWPPPQVSFFVSDLFF